MLSQTKTLCLSAAMCAGLAASFGAEAVTINKIFFMEPANSCQLSIPTTTSQIRPRASGYRNEGAETAFVICGFPYPSNSTFTGNVTSINIQLSAFDGNADSVNCTAVNRQSSGTGPVFNLKTIAVPATGSTSDTWLPADLGDFSGFSTTITCALPLGVQIVGLRIGYDDEVGS